mgnify:CR=1 FL=1
MPELDGLAFFDRVQAQPETRGIPFVMLTAESEQSSVLNAKGRGLSTVLNKPVQFDEIAQAIARIFGEDALKRPA